MFSALAFDVSGKLLSYPSLVQSGVVACCCSSPRKAIHAETALCNGVAPEAPRKSAREIRIGLADHVGAAQRIGDSAQRGAVRFNMAREDFNGAGDRVFRV